MPGESCFALPLMTTASLGTVTFHPHALIFPCSTSTTVSVRTPASAEVQIVAPVNAKSFGCSGDDATPKSPNGKFVAYSARCGFSGLVAGLADEVGLGFLSSA